MQKNYIGIVRENKGILAIKLEESFPLNILFLSYRLPNHIKKLMHLIFFLK